MQTADDAAAQWDTIRAQIAQGMIEHEVVMQALRAQAIVSALFILTMGVALYFLWRRNVALTEAFHGVIRLHSSERIALVKQHSLEQSSMLMQMLHAFEGIVSRKRSSSASSPISSGSATPPAPPSTGTPPPLPLPQPTPLPMTGRRRTPQQ